jgi:hypothetical protein
MEESDPPGLSAIRSPESIMTIDGVEVHPSITADRIVAARRGLQTKPRPRKSAALGQVRTFAPL